MRTMLDSLEPGILSLKANGELVVSGRVCVCVCVRVCGGGVVGVR